MNEPNRIAFLSTDDLEGYVIDDQLSFGPLRELGWNAETVSWRDTGVDWSEFACAIIRSTWDYQRHLPAFLRTLEQISSLTRLVNPLDLVRWNADKRYLRELSDRGARIVPTIWVGESIEPSATKTWCDELGSDDLVLKPTVSANAENTFRLRSDELYRLPDLPTRFADRPYMVQPFMKAIVDEGEFSLFYFDGEYSHTILKTPKPADFRVQEEHGGTIRPAQPSAELLRAGEGVMQCLEGEALYARVDFVREAGGFSLMELELIEPSLYLRMDGSAPERFTRAIHHWLTR